MSAEKRLFKDFSLFNQSFDKSANNVITSKQIIRNSIQAFKLKKADIPTSSRYDVIASGVQGMGSNDFS
jgi:hypothetical protein